MFHLDETNEMQTWELSQEKLDNPEQGLVVLTVNLQQALPTP
jgi:hypothetical protein